MRAYLTCLRSGGRETGPTVTTSVPFFTAATGRGRKGGAWEPEKWGEEARKGGVGARTVERGSPLCVLFELVLECFRAFDGCPAQAIGLAVLFEGHVLEKVSDGFPGLHLFGALQRAVHEVEVARFKLEAARLGGVVAVSQDGIDDELTRFTVTCRFCREGCTGHVEVAEAVGDDGDWRGEGPVCLHLRYVVEAVCVHRAQRLCRDPAMGW